jgi:hypothetical protein
MSKENEELGLEMMRHAWLGGFAVDQNGARPLVPHIAAVPPPPAAPAPPPPPPTVPAQAPDGIDLASERAAYRELSDQLSQLMRQIH